MTPSDFANALLETTLATSAAIVLVLLLRAPLRRLGGWRAVYALWALVPAAWLAVLLPAPVRYVAAVAPALQAWTAAHAPGAPQAIAAVFDPWPLLLAIWGAGVVVCAYACLRKQRRFMRSLGAVHARRDGLLQAETCAGLPAVVGLQPKVVLPADFYTRYRAHEQMLILAHERVHAARGDLIGNACAALFHCLYWFNPLFVYATARFRRDQELACDETVVARYPQARRVYGETMLKTQLSANSAPLACHWYGQHPLKERIAMLKHPVPNARRTLVGVFAAASIALLATLAAWAAQPKTTVAVPVAANTASAAQPQLITVDVKNEPVRDFALDIAAKAGLRVRNPEILGERRISAKFDRVPADTALTFVAQEAGLLAQIANGEVTFIADASAKPADASGAAMPIDLRMKLSVDGQVSTPHIVSRSGEHFLIRHSAQPGKEAFANMTLLGTATVLADGKIEIATEIRRGNELVGKPTLRLIDGQPGSVEVKGEGSSDYRIEIDASARPERSSDLPPPPRVG